MKESKEHGTRRPLQLNEFAAFADKKTVVTLWMVLLWASFDADAQGIVALQFIKIIHIADDAIEKLGSFLNPACKVPLVVCGHECQLMIAEFFDEEAPIVNAPAHDGNNSPATAEVFNSKLFRYLCEV